MFVPNGALLWCKPSEYYLWTSYPVRVVGYDPERQLFEVIASIDDEETIRGEIDPDRESYGELSIDDFETSGLLTLAVEVGGSIHWGANHAVVTHEGVDYLIRLH